MTRHLLSFDVEEYFHVETFREAVGAARWEGMESRVAESTRRLLDLVDEAGVEATFFVLGWVAERHPGLVREIAARGHEVASHGFGHDLAYALTPERFLDDVRRARELLCELSGQPVEGYRAPSFSITRRNPWALDALAEAGYRWDSSIFPVRHHRYGIPDFPGAPRRIAWADGRALDEYPMTFSDGPLGRLPVAGGGYFRLFPAWVLRRAWRKLDARGETCVFYLHPWELDPGQPRVRTGVIGTWRHYTGLGATAGRLREWLRAFRWTSFRRHRAEGGVPTAVLPREWFDAPAASVPADAGAAAAGGGAR
jgi:polysaccharide deacetylase family protein (PEP-CTERM system associated)